jgi:hypothetical protein
MSPFPEQSSGPPPSPAPPGQGTLRDVVRDAVRDAVRGARDGFQEGGPPTPPPAPQPPASAPSDAAPAGTAPVTFTTDAGEKFAVSWNNGTLTIAQGTEVLAIPTQELIPARAVDITVAICSTLVVLVLGAPLLRYWLRRAERRQAQQAMDAAVAARLDAMERHIDTVAVELERVSEGQRYFTRLLEAREGAVLPPRQG